MENSTDKRTDYERGYRDGYRDGMIDRQKVAPLPISSPTCPKCDLKAEGVMGYVCSMSNCPIFPRATWSAMNADWQKDHDRSKY